MIAAIDRLCDFAVERKVPLPEVESAIFARLLRNVRGEQERSAAMISLYEADWEDLTGIYDVEKFENGRTIRRRLMMTPEDKFFIVEEISDRPTLGFVPISAAKARHLYTLHTIPEQLQHGFPQDAPPRAALDCALVEMEALMALLVVSQDSNLSAFECKDKRVKEGLVLLTDNLAERAREAFEAL